MGYQETLRELAGAHAISTSYTGFGGNTIDVSNDTLIKTLRALGVDLGTEEFPSEETLTKALTDRHDAEFRRPLPRCIVTTDATTHAFNVHVHDGAPAELTITFEDGSVTEITTQLDNWTPPRTIDDVTWGEGTFELPAGLPQGWHTITLVSDGVTDSCTLIVTPARLSTTDTYINSPVAGVMAQMYSVRSENSWGIGDFNDLGFLGETIAQEGAGDFLLINPMHAAEPFPPIEDSPYLPTTRRFTNPIYIRVEDIPEIELLDDATRADIEEIAAEFTSQNRDGENIERNPIYEAKLQVLREIYLAGRDETREQQFRDFIHQEGDGLAEFATWCARRDLDEQAGHGNHAAVPEMEELTEFYMWLQWICDSQLAVAQARCIEAGMKIGIMADLAVGVHPGGADAENLAAVLAPDASVGAPPDSYNQHGQDWSQPPWHPEKLAEVGYKPWRDMLRTVLRHSGGIRVDHVLGLFRLFWIPRMQHPSTGTYVNYDFHALVGILALEAERAGAVVIGEDLGTFEPWVQDVLAGYGIMGTNILWFESSPHHGGARRKEEYRTAALASVTTHDLPPTAGYLEGEHIALRERLGLLITDAEQDIAEDLAWQAQVLNRVLEQGGFDGEDFEMDTFEGRARNERGETDVLVAATHRFIAHTPAALSCTALVDMVGDRKVQNQPGTTKDLYPNWCVPLSDAEGNVVLIEDLASNPLFKKIAAAGKRP
ncbi:MAG: 4-alpha-glucanotransferase [Corynebacterium sp.]|uniref:4-alpha-glucanotransferase n=1 Tax=Corynebacterium sp. TaxID=1720 RepID=UPI0026DCBE97|nr:4-alpha-glucanotransferase [Corynebacterium sp.]MDO5098681.1 4-alpha-glucanotransferase [Corynebacterium sp.]